MKQGNTDDGWKSTRQQNCCRWGSNVRFSQLPDDSVLLAVSAANSNSLVGTLPAVFSYASTFLYVDIYNTCTLQLSEFRYLCNLNHSIGIYGLCLNTLQLLNVT